MTEASRSLIALAKQNAAAYVAQTDPRAILLTGSAAEGLSDRFSDLDLIVYYERLPTPDQLAAAGAAVQVVGGPGVIQELLRHGLVDELNIDIMPLLLGAGLRLFEDGDLSSVGLETLGVQPIGHRANLRFRVAH